MTNEQPTMMDSTRDEDSRGPARVPDLSHANVVRQLREHVNTHYSNLAYCAPGHLRYEIEHVDGAPTARVIVTVDVRAPDADELAEGCPPAELFFEERTHAF